MNIRGEILFLVIKKKRKTKSKISGLSVRWGEVMKIKPFLLRYIGSEKP